MQGMIDVNIEQAKLHFKTKGMVFHNEAENYLKERVREDAITPAMNLDIATKHLTYIEDLKLLIINYDTQGELISSDVPVIALNPFHPPSTGWGCMGLILFFPVAPNKLVVLYDSKM